MRNVFGMMLGVGLMTFAGAVAQASDYSELCQLEDSETAASALIEVSSKDIRMSRGFSGSEVKMLQKHLMYLEYTEAALSLNGMRSLFALDQASNDLHLNKLTSVKTKQNYVQVISYPGENPYSHIFLPKTTELVAYSQDGTFFVKKDGAFVSCMSK